MIRYLLYCFSFLFPGSIFAQQIVCSDSNIADAYRLAINTIDINTRRGILAAGGDYGGEWTRDIAINSWNAVSLLRPAVAERSLWSVTIHKDSIGHQYWDQMIWAIAALNHYKVTGDINFLKQAYACSDNTMKKLEQNAFDKQYGLFTGPSVFNDGIAAYPAPVYDSTNNSSFVLDHPNSKIIKCLSTNCVYYGAYQSLIEMAQLLNVDKSIIQSYQTKADNLKAAILKNFYSEKDSKLYYLIDNNGKLDSSQEGLGISLAIIFNVVNKEQALKLTQHTVISKFGITSIYPDFKRYSPAKPGRHNNIVWPMVSGFYAQACIDAGNNASFANELDGLTHLALDEDKGDYNFREIYNPYTGAPDGGWQANGDPQPDFHWLSCRLQTWSATAYMNMVQFGLAGMRIHNNGLTFAPFLPENVHYLQLNNIPYRNAVLNITLKGNGSVIRSFLVNGKPMADHTVNSNIHGNNDIMIELGK
jgi:glycogen debranching enzyme